MESLGDLGDSLPVVKLSPIKVFYNHLYQTEPVYAKLKDLKDRGWKSTKGDEYFKNRRQRADTVSKHAAARFYQMMKEIGDEMQLEKKAFTQDKRNGGDFQILGLCMAPGGYTYSALKYNKGSKAWGITLPTSQGGHEVILQCPASNVLQEDITMFATEFGVDEIPVNHPARDTFKAERPFIDQEFDLVICDGQVLRSHERPEYREATEATRLTTSQLILALQRIRQGGTMIMLLHRIEAMDTLELLYTFSRFSDIEVFKPVKKHAIKSTFYLIARNVQPDAEAAKEAVGTWKMAWWNATFGGDEGKGAGRVALDDGYAQSIIDSFACRFTELAKPIWSIQLEALRKSEFV
ncbi:hypothetical protein VTL71DRAFT_16170 [Oculimacula yallundae]|uniref:Ribosomal RNA methyltransferase FtsJ domain-containing protein n=1 Tax=Oculimacula yallundae TaxID=86028 RepID=A0ABR4CEX3_9HELO